MRQLFQGAEDGLDGTLNVGLEDEVEFLEFAFAGLARHGGQGHPAGGHLLGQAGRTGFGGAVADDSTGCFFVGVDLELITGRGYFAEAQGFHGVGGTGLFDALAVVIDHGADLAQDRASGQNIAGAQGAVLDQQGRHRALRLIEVSLDHGAAGHAVWVGLQVFHFGDQQDHLQQLVDVLALDGAHRNHHGVAAPVLSDEFVGGELLFDAIRGGAFLVDFVDCHHDRHLGGPGVADGFQGLGADAVIGSHHQHGHVGDLGAAGTHGGERLVARGVEEGELPLFPAVGHFDLVGTDVLCDATGFAGGDTGFAD